MRNWLDNVPSVTETQVIETIMVYLKQSDKQLTILEIGSYEGRSLKGFLERLPETTQAVSIDNRTLDPRENPAGHDIKKVVQRFVQNMQPFEHRLNVYDDSSQKVLPRMTANKFDFIYVDASHHPLDVMADLVLAWRTLKPGGILGLDDYQMKRKQDDPGSVFQAANHFMSYYADEIEVLHNGYRLFVKKKE